ncbi:adhesion G protein-coupled receptor L3-like [Anneissia japonica]|uniref:adhesion G protein-coupled receptor L3-like n=1 Tax=Anneissia japonica TaxID=1529436 RepID=UPI001425671B|nr:adhesion G protein-coupled receptor L3-like [Anneissia japonica]
MIKVITTLHECIRKSRPNHFKVGVSDPQEGDIVLLGGNTANQGRIELYHNGSYGNICGKKWNFDDCSVVCRSLNYRLCYNHHRYSEYGKGNGPLLMYNVECTGYESTLSDCTHSGWGNIHEDCYIRVQIASVDCRDTVLDIRLINGQHPNEGRVEMFDGGRWGTVCDYGWSIDDAMVACRQIGYASAVEAFSGSKFGSDNSLVYVSYMNCLGSEDTLSDCLHNGIGRSGSCDATTTAGVRCSDELIDSSVSDGVVEMINDVTAQQFPELENLAVDEFKYFSTVGEGSDQTIEGVIIKSSGQTMDLTPVTNNQNGIAFAVEVNTNDTIGIIVAIFSSESVSLPSLANSYIASDLVALNVYDAEGNHTRKAKPYIVFPSLQVKESIDHKTMEPVCAFIDEAKSPIEWSDEGCVTTSSDSLTTGVICSCQHLTSFAILMQTRPNTDIKIEDKDAMLGLDVITFTGLSISSVFLLFTICIICSFSDLRKSRRYKMLGNLVISLLFTNFTFCSLAFNIENKIACSLAAACLHYCLLAAFSWMTILSTDMYLCIQHAFLDPEKRFLFFQILGWMFPLLFVTITVAVTRENYASERCWLNISNGVTWTFIGPVMFTILVVTIQLSIVGYVAYTKSQTPHQNDDEKNKLKQIKTLLFRILLLTPVVGLTWIFGILSILHSTFILQYLFVISTSMQGFLIWFTQCFLSKEVNTAWNKFKMHHMSNSVDATIETVS